jgi:hypothetical protein
MASKSGKQAIEHLAPNMRKLAAEHPAEFVSFLYQLNKNNALDSFRALFNTTFSIAHACVVR